MNRRNFLKGLAAAVAAPAAVAKVVGAQPKALDCGPGEIIMHAKHPELLRSGDIVCHDERNCHQFVVHEVTIADEAFSVAYYTEADDG